MLSFSIITRPVFGEHQHAYLDNNCSRGTILCTALYSISVVTWEIGIRCCLLISPLILVSRGKFANSCNLRSKKHTEWDMVTSEATHEETWHLSTRSSPNDMCKRSHSSSNMEWSMILRKNHSFQQVFISQTRHNLILQHIRVPLTRHVNSYKARITR